MKIYRFVLLFILLSLFGFKNIAFGNCSPLEDYYFGYVSIAQEQDKKDKFASCWYYQKKKGDGSIAWKAHPQAPIKVSNYNESDWDHKSAKKFICPKNYDPTKPTPSEPKHCWFQKAE